MKKILWSERIKRPPKPLTFETYLREQDHPISSHPETRDPRILPLVTFDYGSTMARIRRSRYVGKYLVAAVKEMAKSTNSQLQTIFWNEVAFFCGYQPNRNPHPYLGLSPHLFQLRR